MKKHTVAVVGALLAILFSIPAFCQDVIYTKSKEEISGSVKRITPTVVRYVKAGNLHGDLSSIKAGEVDYIIYENGDKEVIRSKDEPERASSENMYWKGKQDARENYDGYKAAKGGTIATTIFFGDIIGLAPAIISSSTPPAEENLNYPDSKLMENHEYNHAYKNEAKKIKNHKVWGGFLLGAVLNAAVWLLLFVALF